MGQVGGGNSCGHDEDNVDHHNGEHRHVDHHNAGHHNVGHHNVGHPKGDHHHVAYHNDDQDCDSCAKRCWERDPSHNVMLCYVQ